jgi:ATP-dependent helicase IRC3
VELRPYQQEAIAAIAENYTAGVRQQLVVLATGLGKTCIAASLPEALHGVCPGKLLFIAHTDELCAQAVAKMRQWNPTLRVGLEKAGSYADPESDIIVSCNASIGRVGSTRMEHFWDSISVIVCDESHRILGESWLRILDDSGVLQPGSKKLLIGLTATPRRRNVARKGAQVMLDDEDMLSLKSVFKKIVYSFTLRKGIKQGFLVPLKGFRIATDTSLDDVKVQGGDFQAQELTDAVDTPLRNTQAYKAWAENAPGRQTLIFTASIAHAEHIAKVFTDNGVKASPISGVDKERKEKLRQFEAGEITVLSNAQLLCEGFDSPVVSCILMARPTRSSTAYCQAIGRGTRLNVGKADCMVIDLVDNYKRCSLVTLPSLVGLDPAFNLHGGSMIEAAEKMEGLQESYPTISLAGITDLSKVKAYIESLDLFAEPYAAEIKDLTKLTWMGTADGAYALQIPESQDITGQYARYQHERLVITQNELGEYELWIHSTQTEKQLGIYNSLQEALQSADEVMQRCRPSRMKLVLREAEWHAQPASDPAKKLLRSLSKKLPILRCLCPGSQRAILCPTCRLATGITAGEASTAITLLKSRRKG